MFVKGDKVKVLPPFDEAFPEVYVVEEIKDNNTAVILEDRDFSFEFLEKVEN